MPAITLRRQGEGFYSVHLHGDRLNGFSVWDRRMNKKRLRGWSLRINGGVLSGGTKEEIFPTLKLLREWVERTYAGSGDPGAQ